MKEENARGGERKWGRREGKGKKENQPAKRADLVNVI